MSNRKITYAFLGVIVMATGIYGCGQKAAEAPSAPAPAPNTPAEAPAAAPSAPGMVTDVPDGENPSAKK